MLSLCLNLFIKRVIVEGWVLVLKVMRAQKILE